MAKSVTLMGEVEALISALAQKGVVWQELVMVSERTCPQGPQGCSCQGAHQQHIIGGAGVDMLRLLMSASAAAVHVDALSGLLRISMSFFSNPSLTVAAGCLHDNIAGERTHPQRQVPTPIVPETFW